MSDLVERLRDRHICPCEFADHGNAILEAADRIEQLEAALRQIAAFKADEYDMDWADTIAEMNSIARAALKERT